MKTQQQVINSLPVHLRPFIATQTYTDYTPRDHAVWRFLMHQLVENLTDTAHPLYIDGLKSTGINIEHIPKIEDINYHLEKFGWRAAVVDGFIPPAVFIEFLAHKVLVVAVNIRSVEHMLYTPAPDIIHESAGHAPFIIDIDYAEYLESVGDVGRRVITNKGDIETYEAIRKLSIVKESPISTDDEISQAEQFLSETIGRHKNTKPSESTLLSRLQWWTTEYGLVGDVHNYKIYGAGLLSSLGESVNCLDDKKVQKIPLTIDAISSTYDITNEQPLLFVAKSCRHLSQISNEFAKSTCYFKGGTQSIKIAIEAETVNTLVYSSGLEVSGLVTNVVEDSIGNPIYINTTGPTQLAYKEIEIQGQGIDNHALGFGSPVGKLQALERCLSTYTIDDLKLFGIEIGHPVTLEFLSGIKVTGNLMSIYRRNGKNLILSFDCCQVTTLQGEVLFSPQWGTFDMAVGESIDSVYGGSADQEKYPLYKNPTDSAVLAIEYDDESNNIFNYYRLARELRHSPTTSPDDVEKLVNLVLKNASKEWLLIFELSELAITNKIHNQALNVALKAIQKNAQQENKVLIEYALIRLKKMEQK